MNFKDPLVYTLVVILGLSGVFYLVHQQIPDRLLFIVNPFYWFGVLSMLMMIALIIKRMKGQ